MKARKQPFGLRIACIVSAVQVLVGCNLGRFGRNDIPEGCQLGTIVHKLPSSTKLAPVVLLSDHHVYRRTETKWGITISGGVPEAYSSGTPIVLCPKQPNDQSIQLAIDIVGRPFEHFKRLR